MPTIQNIVVKAANGTTDVTYTAVAGASGRNPATFRNNSVGTTVMERPLVKVSDRPNGPGTSRRVDVEFVWPMVSQDSGGNKIRSGGMVASASVLVPQNQSETVIQEQVHQFANFVASALMKASYAEGYAPR